MFTKYLFLFFALMLFTGVIGSAVEEVYEELEEEGALEGRNPALALAVRAILKVVTWAAKNCAEEAAKKCKSEWKHPKKLISCAKNFLKANKGRCVAG